MPCFIMSQCIGIFTHVDGRKKTDLDRSAPFFQKSSHLSVADLRFEAVTGRTRFVPSGDSKIHKPKDLED